MCLNNIACLILYSATDKKGKKHQDTATRHKQDLGYFRPVLCLISTSTDVKSSAKKNFA